MEVKNVGRDEISLAIIEELEKPQGLVCNEVRGGNRKFIGIRKTGGNCGVGSINSF